MEMSGNAMMTGGMTPTEALLVADRDRRGYDSGMFNSETWILFLFFILCGGRGFGGWGGYGAGIGANMVNNDFLYTNLKNTMDTGFAQVANQQFGTQKDIWQTQNALGMQMCNGFHNVDSELCAGFNGTQREIMQNRFDAQQCCCETNRNIDAVRYENSKNTCDITTAIHAEGEATRALINANTMQDLRDKLADRDRDLLTANFQLSQQAQSAALVNELRPCPKPAYPSCSPYQVFGWGQCGNGCGC